MMDVKLHAPPSAIAAWGWGMGDGGGTRALYVSCPKCLFSVPLAGLRPVVQPEEDAQQT